MSENTVNTATEETTTIEAKNVFRAVLEDRINQIGVGELREELSEIYSGGVWTSEELLAEYEISHFDPPYVYVIRKRDGIRGTVAYIESPRLYFSFIPQKIINEQRRTAS